MNNNVKKLSDIEASPVIRNRTWFNDLDQVYGTSISPTHNLGMPKGKISLWAGERGVGKSRLCIEVVKKFTTNYSDGKVLYFLTEAPLNDFAQWAVDDNWHYKHMVECSGANKIDEMVEIIYQVRPKLIFIDSVNQIEDFTGTAKSAKRLIDGVEDIKGLREATYDVGAHLILLGQMNGDGKTIKGGSSLPHLVDIELYVVIEDKNKGLFRIEVGTKHRYGRTDRTARFLHTDYGVNEASESVTNDLPDGYRRVSGLSQSGFITVGPDGLADTNDPEFLEHLEAHRLINNMNSESVYDPGDPGLGLHIKNRVPTLWERFIG